MSHGSVGFHHTAVNNACIHLSEIHLVGGLEGSSALLLPAEAVQEYKNARLPARFFILAMRLLLNVQHTACNQTSEISRSRNCSFNQKT